jgi:hypothetical protein
MRKAPASVGEPVDPLIQQETHEVRDAANQLIQAIDTWHGWFSTLRSDGDADPAIALRCHEMCCTAVQALCNHRVNVAPFNKQAANTIFQMLPPLPDGSAGGSHPRWDETRKKWVQVQRARWQESREFKDLYFGRSGRYDSSLELQSAALKVRQLVERYPLAVRPSKASDGESTSANVQENQTGARSKKPARANPLQIFPQGTADIDPNLIKFLQHLLTGRYGKRSDNEIAREFTRETKRSFKKAQSLLTRYRKLRDQGRVSF